MNFTKFSRRDYLQGDTPIEPMKNLSRALGGKVNLFVKRDDLLPGSAGGNKTRKLEFCYADALDKGADTIITCGAIQSNHCRLTAAWAVKENMDCHLVLEERVPGTYDPKASGNNFLFELLGVKTKRVVSKGTDMMAEMEKTAEELRAAGKKPYIIPGGASNEIGATGYANCALETLKQINDMRLPVDHIVVPSGSAGTHAGMAVGMHALNANIPVFGINVSLPKEAQEEKVFALATKLADHLEIKGGVPREAIVCDGDYVGPGYSVPSDEMVEAVKLFAGTEGILLDPVYSGKVAAGLIGMVRNGAFPEGANVLFLHTGGSPALYAYLDTFRD